MDQRSRCEGAGRLAVLDGLRESWEAPPDHDHKVGSVIAAALAFLLFCVALGHAQDTPRIVPDPATTPGAINPDVTQDNIHQTICVPGWTKTIRPPASYTSRLKYRQLGYGPKMADYEEDHYLPLELGGHPTDPRNLWPQLWSGPLGAHIKDRLENYLHGKVCSGDISLISAQKCITTNWVECWKSNGKP